MASGFDDIKNGLGFGALFGALVAYVGLMPTAASWISWYGNLLTKGADWFLTQTWWPASISATVMAYVISIVLFAIIGAIIDKK